MGEMHEYIRGRTKIEIYKKFHAEVNRKEIEGSTRLYSTWMLAREPSPKSPWFCFIILVSREGMCLTQLLVLLRCHVALGAHGLGKQKSESLLATAFLAQGSLSERREFITIPVVILPFLRGNKTGSPIGKLGATRALAYVLVPNPPTRGRAWHQFLNVQESILPQAAQLPSVTRQRFAVFAMDWATPHYTVGSSSSGRVAVIHFFTSARRPVASLEISFASVYKGHEYRFELANILFLRGSRLHRFTPLHEFEVYVRRRKPASGFWRIRSTVNRTGFVAVPGVDLRSLDACVWRKRKKGWKSCSATACAEGRRAKQRHAHPPLGACRAEFVAVRPIESGGNYGRPTVQAERTRRDSSRLMATLSPRQST